MTSLQHPIAKMIKEIKPSEEQFCCPNQNSQIDFLIDRFLEVEDNDGCFKLAIEDEYDEKFHLEGWGWTTRRGDLTFLKELKGKK